MYLSIRDVKPANDFRLILIFENGEVREFDMKPYLDKGIFRELNNPAVFNSVKVSFDTVEWNNGADFDPEVLYSHSRPYGNTIHTLA